MSCLKCKSPTHCANIGRCFETTTALPVETVYVSALEKQVSGSHYKDKGIQPIVYIHANNLGFCEGNVIKYVTRHKDKNGAADIKKAIHYLELLLELEYKNEVS
jgi:hypothetical protein